MSWFDSLLWPIMWVVAWVMVALHKVLDTIGLGPSVAWTLSIVGLTIIIRIVLIPLFFRQIKASRGLQLIQPEIRELQKKYKGKTDQASREAMAREQMELYKKHKTNPFSSCLPILAQSPVFFALFRVLNSLRKLAEGGTVNGQHHIGPLDANLASQAESATLFGAPLSAWFLQNGATTTTRIVTVILILCMSGAQFFMMRQLTMKNMPPAALEGPIAQQQKMMMYAMPLIFAVTGVNFPVGVLIYWTVSNFWTVGQQFYAIRKMPAPGSQAEAALEARRARKAEQRGRVPQDVPEATIEEKPRPSGQRQQPMSKARSKKQGQKPRPERTVSAPEPAYGTADSAADKTMRDKTEDEPVLDAPELGLDGSGALDEKTTTRQPSGPTRPNKPKKPKKKN
ncbi:MAG: membrane protein insertase YidC [Micrococcales bacterium]|nr:membrane protein insertase YidC [Micrococcales bacterium]